MHRSFFDLRGRVVDRPAFVFEMLPVDLWEENVQGKLTEGPELEVIVGVHSLQFDWGLFLSYFHFGQFNWWDAQLARGNFLGLDVERCTFFDLEGAKGDNVAVFVSVEHGAADSVLSLELDTGSLLILQFFRDVGVVFKRLFPHVP